MVFEYILWMAANSWKSNTKYLSLESFYQVQSRVTTTTTSTRNRILLHTQRLESDHICTPSRSQLPSSCFRMSRTCADPETHRHGPRYKNTCPLVTIIATVVLVRILFFIRVIFIISVIVVPSIV